MVQVAYRVCRNKINRNVNARKKPKELLNFEFKLALARATSKNNSFKRVSSKPKRKVKFIFEFIFHSKESSYSFFFLENYAGNFASMWKFLYCFYWKKYSWNLNFECINESVISLKVCTYREISEGEFSLKHVKLYERFIRSKRSQLGKTTWPISRRILYSYTIRVITTIFRGAKAKAKKMKKKGKWYTGSLVYNKKNTLFFADYTFFWPFQYL